MPDLHLRLNKDVLTVAPLLTWQLLDLDLDTSECLEYLNVLDDELVQETHRRFKLAGAQCVCTNTLRANRTVLQQYGLEDALVDINRIGVRLAREAGFEHILATVSLADPEVLLEQVAALLSEDPDALWLVGEAEADDLNAAIDSIKAQTSIPLIAAAAKAPSKTKGKAAEDPSITKGAAAQDSSITKGKAAQDPSKTKGEAAQDSSITKGKAAQDPSITKGADIIYYMGKPTKESLEELRILSELYTNPLMVCPKVGRPEGATDKQRSLALNQLIDTMADFALEARALGAQFIGTAPGSSPAFTGSVSAVLSYLL